MIDKQFLLSIGIEMKIRLSEPLKCAWCEKQAIAVVDFVIEHMPVCAGHLEEQAKVWVETHSNFIRIIKEEQRPEVFRFDDVVQGIEKDIEISDKKERFVP